MKLITAIVQPHRFKDVKDALTRAGVTKMTVTNVVGCGQQKGYDENYRGQVVEVNLLKKVKLEIAVNDDLVEATIQAIIEGARTGNIGDGKIFVTDLKEVIRIRTGERGKVAC
ncbi:MAG: P-II family nitrogen regulator [Leptospiraceae bacterium]|nr:P-II family nitrogen regulator [Leptospiraceae bacterium]MDW8305686.1 P-II family nitrogen regulator [Leptospiraceae bacterium]